MALFFIKQKTAYEMRISDWSSDVCSSDLAPAAGESGPAGRGVGVVGGGAARGCEGVGVGRLRDRQDIGGTDRRDLVVDVVGDAGEIGRASCRERVCQYV